MGGRCATIRWPCCAATSAWCRRRRSCSARPSAKTWRLARRTPRAEELPEAAEAAHIRQEFEEFPQGFETMVGERGVTLSGGQKQRAAIARALLRRPAILILDDALSSVDTYTEERILNGFAERRLHFGVAPRSSFRIGCRRCETPTRSPYSITEGLSNWAGTMNCWRGMATTPAFIRNSNLKKSSASRGRLSVRFRSDCESCGKATR